MESQKHRAYQTARTNNLSTNVISKLLSYSPCALNAEVISDESIFYTFKKSKTTLYLQHFFETDEDGFNSSLVSYKGNKKLDSIHGDINQILSTLDKMNI